MSSKSVNPPSYSNYIVPLVLLCAVCVAASFSSLIYAIAVRADIDALSARLAALESRDGCDNKAPLRAARDRERNQSGYYAADIHSSGHLIAKRSPSQNRENREFLIEDDVEDISRDDRRQRGRRRGGGGREEGVVRTGPRMTGVTQTQTPAIHFEGDSSSYSMGHRHYGGNGRVRHPDAIFKDWRIKALGNRVDRHFRFERSDGKLTIRESGIYFVYAQVYYSDDHDLNGFRVMVNDSPVLQCTITSHGGGVTKSNTCFTGGIMELQVGDSIVIKDLAALRYSIFEPGKSFFGLYRVAHHNAMPREGL